MAQSTPLAGSAAALAALREAVVRQNWRQIPALAKAAMAAPVSGKGQNPTQTSLGIYAEYWWLRAQFETAQASGSVLPEQAARDFMAGHPGTYLAERLRGNWILAAARTGDFARVRQLQPAQVSNAQIECAQLHARHVAGPAERPKAEKVSAQQALAVFAAGDACWALLDQLQADRVLGWDDLVPRWREAIEGNHTVLARRFAERLLTDAQIKVYDKILRDPRAWLANRSRTKPTTPVQREVLVIAIARAARQDREAIDKLLREVWQPLLPEPDHAWARSQVALIAALNLDPRAHSWYRDAGLATPLTQYNHAWRVRSALRQKKIDWAWVRQTIAQMPASQQAEPVWVYWDARALAAGNQPEALEAARARYARIAEQYHFYGQLAAEELGRPLTAPPPAPPVDQAALGQVRARPGLQRAIELFRLGWRSEAVPEWNFSLRGMNDAQLRAAAELAREAQIYDRVINTSERTQAEADFSQRYIAPFAELLRPQAESLDLDTAWVYGLIRQESRFIVDARSPAGAGGLMQLMPATARWTAKRIEMDDFSPEQVYEAARNITLGTHYLNIVLQDLGGSQLLASAGYNAGPGRARLWRARLSHPVEGAIFAETIPFTETRLYAKNVLANATWYDTQLGRAPQSLKARLGQVAPQPNASSGVP